MEPDVKDLVPIDSADTQTGWLLAALHATTRTWRAELGRVGVDRLRKPIHPGGHSIGAILLHIADAEAYWLHEIAAGRKMTSERRRTLMSDELDQYAGKWPIPPKRPLAWYFEQQDAVRAETIELLGAMPAGAASGSGARRYTLRRILHHVDTHEAYHGGQAVLLKAYLEHGVTYGPVP